MKTFPEAPKEPLKICCVTWNVGNADPKSMEGLLPSRVHHVHGPDLFVFGFQEASYGKVNLDMNLSEIRGYIKKALRSTQKHRYYEVSHLTLGQMKIFVFARHTLKDAIDQVHTASEATGIAGVVGNKGGLCVSLRLFGTTRVCFISAHLNAHRGEKYKIRRNDDVKEILRTLCHTEGKRVLPKGQKCGTPLLIFDHVFFMGDLNYRLNIEDLPDDMLARSASVRFVRA